ncbi:MAG: ABC-2 transporter permease [Oscillospiraceae bacterium]|nr:ABC-2 transporter permease [Oscillospiraceae bacterium]
MSKLKSFVGLDFVTVRPYFTVKSLLMYAAVAVFMSIISGSIASGAMIGVMYGMMFMGYPFVLGEKGNLDALYTTLSLDRKTVVTGRYIFTLTINLCAITAAFALSAIGVMLASFILGSPEYGEITAEALWLLVAVAAAFFVMQSLLLPVYFKLGYTKAKFFTIVPLIALMAGYAAVSAFAKDSGIISGIIESISAINSGLFAVFAVLALCFVVFISYRLSLAFYMKREF